MRAAGARDSLAKTIYGRLFDYIVARVNVALHAGTESLAGENGNANRCIGVLDIFGFEIFEKNSFEQLCINFCNEMLQQQFNRAVFKKEEALYITEGIDYSSISYVDNQGIIDLVEKKKVDGQPFGLLPMIDDHGILAARADDSTYLAAITARHGSTSKTPSDFFVGAPASDDRAVSKLNKLRRSKGLPKLHCARVFGVVHYAGEVLYDVSSFREKNADELFPNLHATMSRSSIPLLKSAGLFPPSSGDGKTKKRASQQKQFIKSLHDLIHTMEATEQHYVRCIKSNTTKTPMGWEGQLCLQQLKYAGVFEAVEIRQRGFPFRWSFFRFWRRYWMVAPAPAVRTIERSAGFPAAKGKGSAAAADTPAFKPYAEQLVASLRISDAACVEDMQLGKTLVLYRAAAHRALEGRRAAALSKGARTVVRFSRGCIGRKKFNALDELRRAVRTHRLGAIAARDLGLDEMARAYKLMRESLDAATDGGWFPEDVRPHWEWRRADEEGAVLGRRVAVAQALTRLVEGGCDADDDRYHGEYGALLAEAETLGMDGAAVPALVSLLSAAREVYVPAKERREAQRMLGQGLASFDMRLLEKALLIIEGIVQRGGGAYFDLDEVQRAREAIASVTAELELVALVRNALPLAPLVGQPGSITRSTDDPRECDALEHALAVLKGSRMRLRSRDALDIVRAGQSLLWMRQCALRRDWDEVRQAVAAMRSALEDGALGSDDLARTKDELELVEAELHSHRIVDDLADALRYSDVAANFEALERERTKLRASLRAGMEREGRGIDAAALANVELAVERSLPSTPPQEMPIDLSKVEDALTNAQRVMSAMGVDIPDAGPRLSRLLAACVLVLELHSALQTGGARPLSETTGVVPESTHDVRALLLDRETVDASRLHELLHGGASAAARALEFVTKGGVLGDVSVELPQMPVVTDEARLTQSVAAAALLLAAQTIYSLRRALLASKWAEIGTIIAAARNLRLPACAEREIGAAFSEWSYRRATQRKLEEALGANGCLDGPIGQLDVELIETESLAIAVRGALALDIGAASEDDIETSGLDSEADSASMFAALVMGSQAVLRVRLALKDRNLAAVEAALNDIDELHRTGSPILEHPAALAEVGRARVEYDHHIVSHALRAALSTAEGCANGPLGKLVSGDRAIETRALSDALALARRSGLATRSPELKRLVESVSLVRDLRLALLSSTTDSSVGGHGASGFRSVAAIVARYKQRLHATGGGGGDSTAPALADVGAEAAVADAAALRLMPQAMAELQRAMEELDFRAHIETSLEVAVEGGRGRVAPHRRQIADANGLQPIGMQRETILLEPLRVAIQNALRVEPRGARLDALLQQAHHLIKTRSALKRNDWSALSSALAQAEGAMGSHPDAAVKEQLGAAQIELLHHKAVRELEVQLTLGGVPTRDVLGRLDRHAIETVQLQQAIRNAEALIKREKVASLDLFAAIRNARLSLAVRESVKRADWKGVRAAYSAVQDEQQRHAMLAVHDASLKASIVAATSFATRRRQQSSPRRGNSSAAPAPPGSSPGRTPMPPLRSRTPTAGLSADSPSAKRPVPAHSGARFGYSGGSLFSHARRRARPMGTSMVPEVAADAPGATTPAPPMRGSVTREQRDNLAILGVTGAAAGEFGMVAQRAELESRVRASERPADAYVGGNGTADAYRNQAGAHNLEALVAREISLALQGGTSDLAPQYLKLGSSEDSLAVPISDALARDVARAQQEAIFVAAAEGATRALRRGDGPSGSAGLGFQYHGVRAVATRGGSAGLAVRDATSGSAATPDIDALSTAAFAASDALTQLRAGSSISSDVLVAPELQAMVPLMGKVVEMRQAVLLLDWESARSLSMQVASLAFVPMDHIGGEGAMPPPPPGGSFERNAAAAARNMSALNQLTDPSRSVSSRSPQRSRTVAARPSSRTPMRGSVTRAQARSAAGSSSSSSSSSSALTAMTDGERAARARTRGGPIVEMATVAVPNYAALSQIAVAAAKEEATLVRRQATHEIAISELRAAIAPPGVASGDPEFLVVQRGKASIDRLEAALLHVMELSAEEASFKAMVAHEVLALQKPATALALGGIEGDGAVELDGAMVKAGEVNTVTATQGVATGQMAFATQGGYAINLLRTARLLLAVRQACLLLPLRSGNIPPRNEEANLALLPANDANRSRCIEDTQERYSIVGAWKELVPFLLTRDLTQVDPIARFELALAQASLRCRAVHGRIAAAMCEGGVEGIPGEISTKHVLTKHLDESIAYAEEALTRGGWLDVYADRCSSLAVEVPTWGLTKRLVAAARAVRLVRAALKRGDLETVRKLIRKIDGSTMPAIAHHELKLVRRHVEFVLVQDELKHALSSEQRDSSSGKSVAALQRLDMAIRRGVDAASENVEPLRPLLRHATHLRKLRAALGAVEDAEAMIADKTAAVTPIEVDAWSDVEAVMEEIAISGLPLNAVVVPAELAHMVMEVTAAQRLLQRHFVIAELRATLSEIEAALALGGSGVYNSTGEATVSYTKLRAALGATRMLHSVQSEGEKKSSDVLPEAHEHRLVARATEILAESDVALRRIDSAMAAPCVAIATIEASLLRAEQIGLAESEQSRRGRELVQVATAAISRLRCALDRVVTSEIQSALDVCRGLRLGLVADPTDSLAALDVEAKELTERSVELLALPQAQLVRHQVSAHERNRFVIVVKVFCYFLCLLHQLTLHFLFCNAPAHQLHAALRTQDEDRIIDITVAIKAQFFARIGHDAFTMNHFEGMKTPVQFTARLQQSNQVRTVFYFE